MLKTLEVCFASVLFIVLIVINLFYNNQKGCKILETLKNLLEKFLKFFKKILNSYTKIYNIDDNKTGDNKTWKRVCVVYAILFLVFILLVSFSTSIEASDNKAIVLVTTIVCFIVLFLLSFSIFGILFASISWFIDFYGNNENKYSKIIFSISVSMVLFVLFAFLYPDIFYSHNKFLAYVFLAGTITFYLRIIELLFIMIKNPFNAVNSNDDKKSEQSDELKKTERSLKRIIISSITIVIMMILDLFFMTLGVNCICNNAYTFGTSKKHIIIQLFYYTIISFTTIGYGDVVPRHFCSQILASLISISSVLCLIIFIGSLFSHNIFINEEKAGKS